MKIAYCAILLAVALGHAAAGGAASPSSASVFQTQFAGDNPLSGWQKVGPGTVAIGVGYQNGRCVSIDQPTGLGPGTTVLMRPLPIAAARGRLLHVVSMIRADGVANPPNSWNGIKLMLKIVSPGGTQYPARTDLKGTFDWRQVEFDAPVPNNATEVDLVIGIEATTGSASYSNLFVRASAPLIAFSAPPSTGGQAPDARHAGIPRLRGAMVDPDVKPDDLQVLGGAWGANLIRYQISDYTPTPPWVTASGIDLDIYDKWLRGRLDHLDSILPVCRRLGIRVVVDLHTPAGGEVGSDPWQLFEQKRLQDRFLAIWDKIAHRYKGSDVVWGYDVVNEPDECDAADGLMDWQQLAERTAKLIRSIDKRHAIIVEPYYGSPEQLKYLKPIPVAGVVYSVHMYTPSDFTMQGLNAPQAPVSYPGVIDGVLWNRDRMAAYLADVVTFQKRYRVPIYIGEFSVLRWAPDGSGERYLSDAISLFEQYGWDWSYHAFREYQGWSVEFGSDRNATAPDTTPTPREMLLRSWYAKNVKPRE